MNFAKKHLLWHSFWGFCLLFAHLFRVYWVRLKEAVRAYKNFLSDGARIFPAASALGTPLLSMSMWYTIPLLGPFWEH